MLTDAASDETPRKALNGSPAMYCIFATVTQRDDRGDKCTVLKQPAIARLGKCARDDETEQPRQTDGQRIPDESNFHAQAADLGDSEHGENAEHVEQIDFVTQATAGT